MFLALGLSQKEKIENSVLGKEVFLVGLAVDALLVINGLVLGILGAMGKLSIPPIGTYLLFSSAIFVTLVNVVMFKIANV